MPYKNKRHPKLIAYQKEYYKKYWIENKEKLREQNRIRYLKWKEEQAGYIERRIIK